MSDAIQRQFEMLRTIPRLGAITVQQLHQRLANLGFATTERTVQRDLLQLSAMFSLECDDQKKPHDWRWIPHMPVCHFPGLSIPEALAFHMLGQFGQDLLPLAISSSLQTYFIAAKRQLDQDIGPTAARNWVSKVRAVAPDQPLLPPLMCDDVLQALHHALMHNACLRIRYREKTASERLVHPLGLVQHGKVFYVVVHYDGYEDIRLLALQRVRAVEVDVRAVVVPAGFDLDRYIASGGLGFGEVGTTVPLEIRTFNYAGQHLLETQLSADQHYTDHGGGELTITATVQLTRRLRWWLLKFGSDIEVVQPASLRNEIREKLAGALARYTSSSTGSDAESK